MLMEPPTLIENEENLKEFRFGAGDSNPYSDNHGDKTEVVESIRILLCAQDSTILLEIEELDLQKISFKNGILRLVASQRLHTEFAKFQKEVAQGRIEKRTRRWGPE